MATLNDFLNSTGRLRENLRSEANTEVEQIISNWLAERIEIAQNELEQNDRVGTGALKQSVRAEIETDDATIVKVLAEDYWDFINSGVNGVANNFGAKYSFKNLGVGSNMKQAFREFIQVRGITPREPEMSYDSLAYVLARSVKKKGIRKTPFMDEGFSDEAIKELADRLGKGVTKIFE